MASFMISPTSETAWRQAAGELIEHVRARWPDATELGGETPGILVQFRVDAAGEPVDAYLAEDGITLWVEGGSGEQAAELASWYREQVPDDLEVEFADEGYEGEVAVTPGMTAQQIAEQYEAGFGSR